MTTDFRALCAELADELDAETGYTKNDGERITHTAVAFARAALATPPPEPPTVMEIFTLIDEIDEARLGQIDLVRAALERWDRPATSPPEPLRPIPVSERLPEAGDCAPWPSKPKATPWCWAGRRFDHGWEWAQISMLGLSANSLSWCFAGGAWSHWLPANTIPFPEVTQ